MKRIFLTLSLFLLTTLVFGQELYSTAKRDTLNSEILNDQREISVYLPPDYFSGNQKFPVLYILDGDYNFKYVSGLLELQSSISENIPEMILVGISGKGSETYRYNCNPNINGIKDRGNADQVAAFIEKELVPYVNKNYKTADYKILAGHSIGGLFVINTALNKPRLFNNYIAISPALWWENNAINTIARENIDSDYKTNTYVSLANEKGMGVDSFLSVATGSILKKNIIIWGIALLAILIALFWFYRTHKKLQPLLLVLFGLALSAYLYFLYYPSNENFKFNKFPNRTHNSVGPPTYVWALHDIFSGWKIDQQYFTNAGQLQSHFDNNEQQYGTAFNMPKGILSNTIYILQDNPEELKNIQSTLEKTYPASVPVFNTLWADRLITNDKSNEAAKLLTETIKKYPGFYESYDALAKINYEKKNLTKASRLIKKSLALAGQQKLRQWQINELLETKDKIDISR